MSYRLMLLGIAAILAIASCGETATSTPLTSLEYSSAPLNAELGVEIPDMVPTLAPRRGVRNLFSQSAPS